MNNRILHRPLLLATIVCLALVIWLGLVTSRLAIDQPLPPEKISAHRLRVNTSQLTIVQNAITTYQSPVTPDSIRSGLFTPPPK